MNSLSLFSGGTGDSSWDLPPDPASGCAILTVSIGTQFSVFAGCGSALLLPRRLNARSYGTEEFYEQSHLAEMHSYDGISRAESLMYCPSREADDARLSQT